MVCIGLRWGLWTSYGTARSAQDLLVRAPLDDLRPQVRAQLNSLQVDVDRFRSSVQEVRLKHRTLEGLVSRLTSEAPASTALPDEGRSEGDCEMVESSFVAHDRARPNESTPDRRTPLSRLLDGMSSKRMAFGMSAQWTSTKRQKQGQPWGMSAQESAPPLGSAPDVST